MAETKRRSLSETLRPWRARLAVGVPLFLAIYQFACDQFGAPTLPRLWGMTGAAFPWWGWLLIAQTGFVYALFEYVRRNVGRNGLSGEDETPLRQEAKRLREKSEELNERYKAVITDYQNMRGLEARVTDMLDGLKKDIQLRDNAFDARHLIDERNLREFREEVVRDHSQLFLALQAIRARETERFYAEQIMTEGEKLEEPVENRIVLEGDRWNEWLSHRNRFESSLGYWLELGVGWHPKIAEWVNDVDTKSLTLPDWGDIDALVPGTNNMIEYKTTIIRLRNWKRLRNHVAMAIHHAAFGGPHAFEVLQHIPGGGPSVERVKEKLIEQSRGETLRRIVEGNGEG